MTCALFLAVNMNTKTFAQSTSPRWSTTKNGDNTGRTLTYKKITFTDAAGVDTLKVNPGAGETFISGTINDSLVLSISPITSSYYGDKINCLFTNSSGSGHKVEFITTNVELGTSGKITLTASKRANVVFIFDGVKWIELSRTVQ